MLAGVGGLIVAVRRRIVQRSASRCLAQIAALRLAAVQLLKLLLLLIPCEPIENVVHVIVIAALTGKYGRVRHVGARMEIASSVFGDEQNH